MVGVGRNALITNKTKRNHPISEQSISVRFSASTDRHTAGLEGGALEGGALVRRALVRGRVGRLVLGREGRLVAARRALGAVRRGVLAAAVAVRGRRGRRRQVATVCAKRSGQVRSGQVRRRRVVGNRVISR